MKKLLLCLLLAAAAAWYFFGRTGVSESDVRDFYQHQFEASNNGDVDGLCRMLASDFQGVNITHLGPRQLREVNDREETCDSLERFYEQMKKLHAIAGDEFKMDGDTRSMASKWPLTARARWSSCDRSPSWDGCGSRRVRPIPWYASTAGWWCAAATHAVGWNSAGRLRGFGVTWQEGRHSRAPATAPNSGRYQGLLTLLG
jgi:hypothetical protein